MKVVLKPFSQQAKNLTPFFLQFLLPYSLLSQPTIPCRVSRSWCCSNCYGHSQTAERQPSECVKSEAVYCDESEKRREFVCV